MGFVKCNQMISLDGFSAGLNQTLENPMGGVGVNRRLGAWMFEDAEANAPEIADVCNAGAFIMGRNMFGADRGDWDLDWTGWWGPEPPYHGPVFVLAHRPRPMLTMGETTFTFVTDGAEAAFALAKDAAGDRNISIAGGANTVQQYLRLGLIEQLRLHVVPVVLGAGEPFFKDVGEIRLTQESARATDLVTHITYRVG